MEWTIYSIGSAVYLEEILNAVAMISGTGSIESLAKIGLMLGTFILAFQAVFNGTGIQFQKLLVCFILYLAMYGPTGTALIEDVYTKEVAVVDNVPLGPLAVGSIMSNIGYTITELFETAFSTPAMTSYGFADPLTALIKVRKAAYNVISLPSFTGGGGNASLLSSWSNYIKECTLVAANNDERTLIKMLSDPAAIGALRFESEVYYTKIFDGSAEGKTVTCTQAYAELSANTMSESDSLMEDLSTSFATTSNKPTGADIEARVNDALINIAGGVVDARNYAVMSAILPILEGAPGERAVTDMQGAAAIMMNQAMQQQNTQWAAEGSMFTRYIRPFMTFFEGFIYAITPLMAFVIVLGGFGIGLVSKYLLILIWMTLWMPVLAIVNLYTLSTTKAKLEALTGSTAFGTDGLSFNTLRDMLPLVEAQLGVAGMMASSVPALCMFLVYGTSVAASGIASRLNGSDTINEKIASPDIVQPGAGLSMTSQVSHDPTNLARATGSEATRPTLTMGSGYEKSKSSASENLQAASETYTQAFTNQLGKMASQGQTLASAAEYGKKIGTTLGLSENSQYASAREQLRAAGVSETKLDAITFAAAGGVSTNANGSVDGSTRADTSPVGPDGKREGPQKNLVGKMLGAIGISGSAGVTDSSQEGSTSSTSMTDQDKLVNQMARAVQSNFTKDQALSTAEKLQTSQDFKNDASFTDALSKQSADLTSSKETYSNLEAYKDSFGMQSSMPLDSIGRGGRGAKLMAGLDKVEGDDRDKAQSLFDGFKMAHGTTMGNENASYAAAAYALAGVGRYDLIGDAIGAETANINPDRNSGLATVGAHGNEERFDARPQPGPTFNASEESARIQSQGQAGVANARANGTDEVKGAYNSRLDESIQDRQSAIKEQWGLNPENNTFGAISKDALNATSMLGRYSDQALRSEEDNIQRYEQAKAEYSGYNLPESLAHVAARAETGTFDQQSYDYAVDDLQKNHNFTPEQAAGAVAETVGAVYHSGEHGGPGMENLRQVFDADQHNFALRP